MGNKLENVKKLYLDGIKKGQLEAVDLYTGERYTQHSTGVRDGVDGFKEFFEDFLKRTNSRDIQLVRCIEDGNYVFVHAYQNIDNGAAQWITTDMFDTDDNDKIIEHWDTIAPYKEAHETASGHDMVRGDFQVKDLAKTEINKATIRSFLVEIFQNRNYAALDCYINKDSYVQHNPNLKDGVEPLRQFLAQEHFTYDYVFHVMGQGDHVVSLSKANYNGKPFCVFDIFRMEAGQIVEHWDNMEPILEKDVNGGKF